MITNSRIPINRLNRYYDEEDFKMELEMAREVIEEDMNISVVLYRINMAETDTDDLYGETKKGGVRYYPPVELNVIPTLMQPEAKTYNPNGTLRYLEYGNFNFTLLQVQLDEMNIDIRIGDVIGYADSETNIKYFEVFDDGRIIADNQHTVYGYKGYFRSIKCVVLDPNKFDGI